MLRFEDQLLKHELEQLPPRSRVAFAASCAQRLASVYHDFVAISDQADRTNLFGDALNYIWTHILITPEKAATGRILADVMALIPDEDAPGWTPLTPFAEDALSAVAYCLRCLQSGDAQEAVWAAQRLFDALDTFLTNRDDIAPSEPESELRILRDPVTQAELERQARDIADLRSAGDSLSQELLDRLRQRSVAEQALTMAS
jgi:uncharacterized protein YjaG (DUF416 family)